MVEISNMTLNDLNDIKDILTSDFDDFWTYSILESELKSSNSYYLVAKDNKKIVGFAGIKISLPDSDIMNIVVNKNYRHLKIGSYLLKNLIILANSLNVSSIFLEVNESNFPAISLYKKFNFKEIGFRKNYYKNNNAIIMTLNLK